MEKINFDFQVYIPTTLQKKAKKKPFQAETNSKAFLAISLSISKYTFHLSSPSEFFGCAKIFFINVISMHLLFLLFFALYVLDEKSIKINDNKRYTLYTIPSILM